MELGRQFRGWEHWLYKLKDQNLNPQHPCKKTLCGHTHASNPSLRRDDCCVLLTAGLVPAWVRDPVQRDWPGRGQSRSPASSSGLSVVHYVLHTHTNPRAGEIKRTRGCSKLVNIVSTGYTERFQRSADSACSQWGCLISKLSRYL